MTRPTLLARAAQLILALTLGLAAAAPAGADEADEAVNKVLRDRSATFCKAVLPAWLASKDGIREPRIRALVVDCYLGRARLAVLGAADDVTLEGAALSELPARLLAARTGMSLDPYQPLAGLTVINRPAPR